MSKDVNQLATQIKQLVDELVSLSGQSVSIKKSKIKKSSSAPPKGAAGALSLLKDEGYFDKPRELSAVVDKLKEMGFYHKLTTISMNLLNMTRKRELIRFKSKDTKNWEYVIRK